MTSFSQTAFNCVMTCADYADRVASFDYRGGATSAARWASEVPGRVWSYDYRGSAATAGAKVATIGNGIKSGVVFVSKNLVWEGAVYPLYGKTIGQLNMRDQIILASTGTASAALCVMTFTVFSNAFFGIGLIGSFFIATQSLVFHKEQMKKVKDKELCGKLDGLRTGVVVPTASHQTIQAQRLLIKGDEYSHRKEELKDLDYAVSKLRDLKPRQSLDDLKQSVQNHLDGIPETLKKDPKVKAAITKVSEHIAALKEDARDVKLLQKDAIALRNELFSHQDFVGISDVWNELRTSLENLYAFDINISIGVQKQFCAEIEAIIKKICPDHAISGVEFPITGLQVETNEVVEEAAV